MQPTVVATGNIILFCYALHLSTEEEHFQNLGSLLGRTYAARSQVARPSLLISKGTVLLDVLLLQRLSENCVQLKTPLHTQFQQCTQAPTVPLACHH
jgi:hypothetical protein